MSDENKQNLDVLLQLQNAGRPAKPQNWCQPAKPDQKLNFQKDIPNEVTLMVANQLHILPRKREWQGRVEQNVRGGLDALSRVNKMMRALVTPTLFSRLKVYSGEHKVHEKLSLLINSPEILQAARAPSLLLNALSSMPAMVELRLSFAYGDETIMAAFSQLVRETGLRLSQVKGMDMSGSTDIDVMRSICPNIERAQFIINESPRKTKGLAAFSSSDTLKEIAFNDYGQGWTQKKVKELTEIFPNATRLVIQGELFKTRASAVAPILANFSKLEYLALTTDPAVNPSPYLMDDRLLDEIDDLKDMSPYREDSGKIARHIFGKCKSLRDLCLNPHLEGELYKAIVDEAGVRQMGQIDDDERKGAFNLAPMYDFGVPQLLSLPRGY